MSRRSQWLFAASVLLLLLALVTAFFAAAIVLFGLVAYPMAGVLLLASFGCSLGAVRWAEGRGRLALGWWVLLGALPAWAGGVMLHAALCGSSHGPPTATMWGFGGGVWLLAIAVGLATRGRGEWTVAAGFAAGAPVLLALGWWQTDRVGMLLGAATDLPPPALAVLLADGRSADVEDPVRSFTWAGPHPDRPLRGAVWASRADAVQLLLDHGADPLYEEHVHLSLLADALDRGDPDVALALVAAGAGRSPAAMESVARRGEVASVRWLLERGAPVCGFAEAAVRGDEALVERLIAAALPERRVRAAELALGSVAHGPDPAARIRLAQKLLAMGASPDADHGQPLTAAMSRQDADLAVLLLDAGARPYLGGAMLTAIGQGRADLVRLLIARGGPLPDDADRSWLWAAASLVSAEITDILLDGGVPVEVPGDRHPALCSALAWSTASLAVVTRLLEAGASVEQDCSGTPARTKLTRLGPEFEALLPR